MKTYEELSRVAGVTMDGSPAELVARRARSDLLFAAGRVKEAELAAAALLADIRHWRWVLDQPTFEFHVGQLSKQLRDAEAEALALAAAARMLWDEYRRLPPDQGLTEGRRNAWVNGRPVLLLRRGTAERMSVLAAGPAYLESGLERNLEAAEGRCHADRFRRSLRASLD